MQLIDTENVKYRYRFSDQEIIEVIQKWSIDHGKIPTAKDFEYETPSRMTIARHFGSWNNAIGKAGFDNTNSNIVRSRSSEIQQISEFKKEGAIDLAGKNRHSTCDGICPKGEMFDTKSASLTLIHGHYGWKYYVSINQLIEADYIFIRAYKDKDFTIPPLYKWRVPIDFMENNRYIIIYNDDITGTYNIKTMLQYEIE